MVVGAAEVGVGVSVDAVELGVGASVVGCASVVDGTGVVRGGTLGVDVGIVVAVVDGGSVGVLEGVDGLGVVAFGRVVGGGDGGAGVGGSAELVAARTTPHRPFNMST